MTWHRRLALGLLGPPAVCLVLGVVGALALLCFPIFLWRRYR